MAKNYLSKVNILGQVYEVKDLEAREKLATLKTAAYADLEETLTNGNNLPTGAAVKAYIDSHIGAISSFEIRVVNELPVASAATMFAMYLVKNGAAEAGEYIEYVTIREGEPETYTYRFEQIGSTRTDLSNYLTAITYDAVKHELKQVKAGGTTSVHAFGALADKSEATGEIAQKVVSGVKATGNISGSIEVGLNQTATSAQLVKGSYTPAGTVTGKVVATGTVSAALNNEAGKFQVGGSVSAPTVSVTPSTGSVIGRVVTAGTLPSKAKDQFVAPSFVPQSAQYAKNGMIARVDDASETLIFDAATLANAIASAQFTAGSFKEGAFSQGAMPTFENASVVTGIASAKASAPTFTGNKYDLAFAGKEDGDAISASFAGQEAKDMVIQDVKYDKATVNAETTKFTGNAATLNVGDITVPGQSVTVK